MRAVTDESGSVRMPSEGWVEFRITCDGFVGVAVPIDSSKLSYRVELQTAGTVEGQVVDMLGDYAPEGLLVIAFRAHAKHPDLEEFLSGDDFTSNTEVVTARTGAQGYFELNRLHPTAKYHVRAVGNGIATKIYNNAQAGDQPFALVGGRYFGARLEFVTSDGSQPLIVDGITGSTGVVRAFGKVEELGIAWRADEWCQLAGLPKSMFPSSQASRRGDCLAWGPFRSNGPYTQSFHWRCLGYESIEGEIELVPIVAELPVTRYVVSETTLPRGELDIEYLLPADANWSGEQARTPTRFDLVFLRTERTGQRELDSITLRLDPRAGGIVKFGNFPAGTYEVTRRFHMGTDFGPLTQVPNSIVSVLPGESTRVPIDMRELSTVEFVLTDSNLREYTGPFNGVLDYKIKDAKLSDQFRFDGPPYRLVGIPPGEYTFDFYSNLGKHSVPRPVGAIVDSPTFAVEPGKTVQIDFQVEDSSIVN